MPVAASIPEITAVPRICRPAAPAPCGDPQRHAAEDERERRHQDRPQAEPRALQRRVHQALALLEAVLRELDDQDRVLGGEADQHDEADLAVDVEGEAAREEAEEGADHRDRHGEQHAEGQATSSRRARPGSGTRSRARARTPTPARPAAFCSWYERSAQS